VAAASQGGRPHSIKIGREHTGNCRVDFLCVQGSPARLTGPVRERCTQPAGQPA
jgi:hypothetical protein